MPRFTFVEVEVNQLDSLDVHVSVLIVEAKDEQVLGKDDDEEQGSQDEASVDEYEEDEETHVRWSALGT